ncbi:high-affinity branched-chain amino acid transport ATP-binding protein [Actinomadura sp. NBRC 104412]|uniref:ABC transporter ATP-binding protein n=1 Tax=Actinomadura sp. NBRC 104412 TaxID=3032203 RepID=UPI0024A51451|nr:ABC transporter ATP-binding protein [Actinomadura sp. NBRC 104412]GLZ02607.1 high-affinity branched-chain amino acid transport ATP-binding protein [Actinomadura sp. NBRC 104412]
MSFLVMDHVSARYGNIPALFDASLSVERGETIALLGANGAGKTTTLRSISRMVRTSGRIVLDGRDLSRLSTSDVARAGVAHVPEGRGTLVELTVKENLVLGGYGARRKEIRRRMSEVFDTLPRLAERQDQRAGTLSGGEQQMLAIGRALMSEPRLLLLDEPSLGLSPRTTSDVYELIQRTIRERDMTVVLAEQDVGYAMEVADRAYVLQAGYVQDVGPTEDLQVSLVNQYLA